MKLSGKFYIGTGMLFGAALLFFGFKVFDARGGDAANGELLYQTHCLSCHGESARGDGAAAAGLPKRPSNLIGKLNKPFDIDSLTISSVIMAGKPDDGMPGFKNILSKQQAKDIFAWVRAIPR